MITERVYFPSRSLQDPPSSDPPQPDTYPPDPTVDYGYWKSTADPNNDFGGVHTNCGVPNKMFYLLSEGGVHNGITITGIGADSDHVLNAAKAMYRAATKKWESTAAFNFALARERCIDAAKGLDNENGTPPYP